MLLKKKINYIRIALIIVPVLTAIILTLFSLELNRNLKKKMEIQSDNIVKKYNNIKYSLSSSAKILAMNSQIINGIRKKIPFKIKKKIKIFSEELQLPFIAVHDKSGVCIGKIHRLKDDLKDEKDVEYIKNILDKKRKIRKVNLTPSGLALISSQKVYKNKEFIGFVTVGHFYDNFFSFYLKSINDIEILFIRNNKLIGNTLKDVANKGIIELFKENKNEKKLFDMTFGEYHYKAKIIRLLHQNDMIYMIIAINNTHERNAFLKTVFISIIFIIISFFINFFLSRSISKKEALKDKKIEINESFIDKKSQKYKITKREKEVLILIMKGFTNKEISEKSFIAFSTVRKHIYNLYQKTGVKDRKELIMLFSKKINY